MTAFSDAELYNRGTETVLASWTAYARGSVGASFQHHPGVDVAVFPNEPERAFFNNAILKLGLPDSARAIGLDEMEKAYAAAGIAQFAAWVHESDGPMRGSLELRGYRLNETTRAMGMAFEDVRPPRSEVELGSPDWSRYLRMFELPANLLRGADHTAFHLVIARLDGQDAAAALAFDHGGDCGIFNVATVPDARRQGLATALTALQLSDAFARGCQTASLQATPMAESVYTAVGFRDLGQILEYVPKAFADPQTHTGR